VAPSATPRKLIRKLFIEILQTWQNKPLSEAGAEFRDR
jgi:hypothetical protein